MFILNLAASDIIVCLLSLPITPVTNIYKNWFFGAALCRLIPWVQGVSIFICTFSLGAIAVDRYILVSFISFNSASANSSLRRRLTCECGDGRQCKWRGTWKEEGRRAFTESDRGGASLTFLPQSSSSFISIFAFVPSTLLSCLVSQVCSFRWSGHTRHR